ncbi:vitamin K epoxide reductase family protein [Ramlibacter rhizophilus]|uniref:NAD-dependent epimerase/dehydratase family protein n=1 Tax=Ramlibacter rhizophilus TaxID=1781167 RepID=A0A4Z0BDU6_9BURK|nr:vitamin K epoxide reductase family protein [Ramlibacter rhizophilus]TFY97462.1 NAD-dependent epimerase/dehydratase family protein [Ramlibacter rhizophilus]
MDAAAKPLVLITGAAGDIGSTLAEALGQDYTVVGLDRAGKSAAVPLFEVDLGSEASVREALRQLRERHGSRIASVIHLAAYFDFTGEDKPLYDKVNVQGTRALLRALQDFEVEQFIYAGTMLVHEATSPGERIDESQPIAPRWAYPRSKAAAEEVIRQERGRIPVVLFHLAGVYDEARCVPTLAFQIEQIYTRGFQSHLYSGDPRVGQSLLHKEDMADAFRRAVDRRASLGEETVLLIGEPDPMGYDELQDAIGQLVHGDKEWTTLRIPKPAAKLGAALQQSLEPVIPDAVDHGRKPFIRPFMITLSDDHYALDIGRARALLGWEPRHRIRRTLPRLIATLKRDPPGWIKAHGLEPPEWLEDAEEVGLAPDALRSEHEALVREQHGRYLWTHFFNIGLGFWLLTGPPALGLQSLPLAVSDAVAGVLLVVFASLSLSWRLGWARYVCAFIGLWLLAAPLVFWAPTAAGYLNDTLVGMLVMGFAVLGLPTPGVSPVAQLRGPDTPPGWSFNPSSWTQRLPIIGLALVGLLISRYLTAYQLGHIDSVWDPFFAGGPDPKNGTEEIITSSVSEAWPVPDAGLGALTYALEILTGVIGARHRWRSMPWLVLLFGMMIVPLGAVSIFFIIIQPIWIGTWCTLCLIGAAAMVVQIPYSLDEIVATLQFLRRRRRAGKSVLLVLLRGDTDEGSAPVEAPREFERSPREVVYDMLHGGAGLPWSLAACIAIGAWLMFSRVALGADGMQANADHLVGALVITFAVTACAEVARPVRWVNAVLGIALVGSGIAWGETTAQLASSVICGLALVALSAPRGPVRERYGGFPGTA